MTVSAQAFDVVYGRSAAGVRARLERKVADPRQELDGRGPGGRRPDRPTSVLDEAGRHGWLTIAHAVTDSDGHIHDWMAGRLEEGPHRVVFDSDSYFATLGMSTAYSEVAVVFRLQDAADSCQIQVLLAPFSYSMYLGIRADRAPLDTRRKQW
jgi:5-hydroxyisourate hydrolase